MYALIDTFNDKVLSRHRTITAAAKAKHAILRRIKAANGEASYLPIACKQIAGDELLPLADSDAQEFLKAEYDLAF